jgi:hypothetical protein
MFGSNALLSLYPKSWGSSSLTSMVAAKTGGRQPDEPQIQVPGWHWQQMTARRMFGTLRCHITKKQSGKLAQCHCTMYIVPQSPQPRAELPASSQSWLHGTLLYGRLPLNALAMLCCKPAAGAKLAHPILKNRHIQLLHRAPIAQQATVACITSNSPLPDQAAPVVSTHPTTQALKHQGAHTQQTVESLNDRVNPSGSVC